MIDIVNHSVKIKDIGLLQFFYPNYIIVDKPIPYSDRSIIFIGEAKYINKIKELGVDYIIVTHLAEYDLTNRLNLLDVSFTRHNRPIPKYLLSFYEDLDDKTFMSLLKHHWVTGKWELKSYDPKGVFIDFLDGFKTDTYKLTRTYLGLLDKVSAEYVELSLLTFLSRVVSGGGNVSNWYAKVINNYKVSKYDLIAPAMENFIDSNIYSTELRVLNFILDLNRRK